MITSIKAKLKSNGQCQKLLQSKSGSSSNIDDKVYYFEGSMKSFKRSDISNKDENDQSFCYVHSPTVKCRKALILKIRIVYIKVFLQNCLFEDLQEY